MNKGLFYAKKLIDTYREQDIAADQVELHLVYHSSAIAALVNEDARKRLSADPSDNSNISILKELLESGVHVEICENTMRQKGVDASDLLPGVKIVVGAYPRIIDLQLQGYAYIKFE